MNSKDGINLPKISYYLFGVFLFIMPISHFPFFYKYLGEMAFVPSIYVLSIILFVYLLNLSYRKKIFWPKLLTFNLFTIFAIFAFFISLVMFYFIPMMEFKGEIAGVKSLKQSILLFLCWFIVFFTVIICRNIYKIKQLLKIVFLSSLSLIIYGILQLISLFNPNLPITHFIAYIESKISFSMIQSGIPYIFRSGRINLTTMEASTAADYLLVICIPVFLYMSLESSKKQVRIVSLVSLFCSFVLLFYTKSKSGFVIGLLLLLILLWITPFINLKKITKIFISIVIISSFLYVGVLDTYANQIVASSIGKLFTMNTENTTSMSTRYGSMVTAINIVKRYPICGVGLGNTGFYYEKYMPQWLKENEEVERQINSAYWQDSKSLIFRILAETGLIGFVLFITVLMLMIYRVFLCLLYGGNEIKNLASIILISLLAVIMEGFVSGSFRMVHWFFVIGLAMAIDNITRASQTR